MPLADVTVFDFSGFNFCGRELKKFCDKTDILEPASHMLFFSALLDYNVVCCTIPSMEASLIIMATYVESIRALWYKVGVLIKQA